MPDKEASGFWFWFRFWLSWFFSPFGFWFRIMMGTWLDVVLMYFRDPFSCERLVEFFVIS